MKQLRIHLPLCICCLLLGGCTESTPPAAPATPTPTVTPVAATPQSKKTTEATPTDKPKVKENKTTKQEAEKSRNVANYQPPYPDRQNPFLAPKRTASAPTNEKGSAEAQVQLLGFVNVDGPRVILSINGQVAPVAEGATESGIEVISINPPAVVLQRERERWQATLEN